MYLEVEASGHCIEMSPRIDKEKVARCFRRAISSYDDHAVVQKKTGKDLVDLLSSYPGISFDRVLEIGCCTGMMTETLSDRFNISTLYINDLVPEFEQTVNGRINPNKTVQIVPVFGDIETRQLPDDLDLVVSNATFQWLEEPAVFFSRLASVIKTDGYLVSSIFTNGTLKEFKELTGIGLDYYGQDELEKMLGESFEIKEITSRKDKLYFPDPLDVLKHFQATGVGGVGRLRWTTGKLSRFAKEYAHRFGTKKGVALSYVSTSVVAVKR